jgi:hypothetical protein
MTEPRSSSAGWRTAAVLAPAAAAALAVTTGWAMAHPPEGSATTAPPLAPQVAPAPDPTVDRGEARLHRQALAAQGRVGHLTRTLQQLRARTEALRAAPLEVLAAASPDGASTPRTGGGGGVSVPAPPAPAAPAPAPAPATHTSTGAS